MKYRIPFLSLLLLCFISVQTIAQLSQPRPQASEIQSSIQKLNVLGSVLYFAAHPDDENTRLIAWLAQEQQFRTAYLSLTRGDGGQNLIGTELAVELGLIRTQELLAARQVDKGEQFFSRANDFGFSKTPEETLAFWGEDKILADAVWVIRNVKPDVIITRFPPDPRGGHGHHQAATILAIEAFKAAADPTKYPEQLQYVDVWQTKRLLWNASNFGGKNSTTASQYSLDIGAYNPLVGQSYGEIAAESRSNHKSQGFGAARQRGIVREYFEAFAGDQPKADLMEGVDVTWSRVKGADRMSAQVDAILADFEASNPERSIPALLSLLESLEALDDGYWKQQKIKEVKDIILACGGIWFESYSQTPKVSVSGEVAVRTDFIVRRPGLDVRILSVQAGEAAQVSDAVKSVDESLVFNQLLSVNSSFLAERTTQPYWLRKPLIQARFDVDNQLEIGSPGNIDGPGTTISLSINGKQLTFERPLVYKYTDPVHGEIYQSLTISPRVTADLANQALVFAGTDEKSIDVVFTSHMDGAHEVEVFAEVPAGWTVSPSAVQLAFTGSNQERAVRFSLIPPSQIASGTAVSRPLEGSGAGSVGNLAFNIRHFGAAGASGSGGQKTSGQEAARMMRVIDYPHIPQITYFPLSSVRLTQVETAVSARRVGYIVGAGDLIPESLRQIGLVVDILEEKDIIDGDLSQYDAIISGIRAYNVQSRMPYMQSKLMEYVAQGGTYMMQYNVSGGLVTSEFGPYPFKLSRLRVTDENAKVTFRTPNSPVLNYPNQITSADFEGWIQERGLYFAIDADPAYEMPLLMNDPNESDQDGSLLIANYGKGKFVYTGLAFFRQLPAGVPGAYRLFVNLIAKAEK